MKRGIILKIAELEKRISLTEVIQEDYELQKIGKSYRVYECPICGGKDHFTIDPDKNMWSTFADCHNEVRGGSVYKYLLTVRGLSDEQARSTMHELAGEQLPLNEQKKTPEVEPLQEPKNLINHVNELYQKQSQHDKNFFLNERGINPELVDKYKLSIFKDTDGRRAMLPVWKNGKVIYYTTRALDGQEPRYKNAKGSTQPLNIDYLSEQHDEPIFVTEGYFDALALESRGFKAISINSASNVAEFMTIFKRENKHNNILIAAFDNDEAGQRATQSSNLDSIQIPEPFKDIAEWGLAEVRRETTHKETMKDIIKSQLEALRQPDNVADYLEDVFYKEVEHMAASADRKTGFNQLDKKMGGLYNGLYVLGGGSGVGKTTLAHQIGDNLVQQGEHVIFFSLEQSKMEIVSKSLARTTAKENLNAAITSLQIRKGYTGTPVEHAISEYKQIAKRMNVIEGNLSTSTATIREKVANYLKYNNVAPVVIVDYLQILQPPEFNNNVSDKKRIDDSVSELKRISRDFGIVVLVISSFNRANYYSQVGFDSFKESGGIEYTADVVLGLQYEVMKDDLFNSEKNMQKKRTELAKAKAESPRQVELVCLKNRFGVDYEQSFSYYAKYDYFEENELEKGFVLSDFNPKKRETYKSSYTERDVGDGLKEIIPNNEFRL